MNANQANREMLKKRDRIRNAPTIHWERGEREALIREAIEAGKVHKCAAAMAEYSTFHQLSHASTTLGIKFSGHRE